MRQGESLTVTLADGASLHLLKWAHVNPNAPVVFCLHGLLQHAGCFEDLAQELTDFTMFSLDVRGRGHSDWTPAETYDLSVYVQDVLAVMAHLGIRQAAFIGTSMGGLIGMMLAAAHPEKVQTLIMNDIGPVLGAAGMDRIAGYFMARPVFDTLEEAVSVYSTVYAPFNLEPERLRRLAKSFVRQMENGTYEPHYDPSVAQTFVRDLEAEKGGNRWNVFEAVTCPLLVLRGETSDILTEQTLAEMEQRYRGKSFAAYTEPVTGHAPFLNQPQTVRVVQDFLREHVG